MAPGRVVAGPALAAARRVTGGRPAGLLRGRGRRFAPEGVEGRCEDRAVSGGPGQDGQQAPRDRGSARYPARRHAERRGPARRHPALPLVHAVPAVRGKRGRPRRRPDVLYADRGYDYDTYQPSPAAGHNTARAWAPTAGSSKPPSRSCTGSAAYGPAGRSATTSTKPCSLPAAASSPAPPEDPFY